MGFAARALTSSAKQDWRTPQEVLDVVRAFAPIALDPFTAADNPTRAARFLTREDNAFMHDWLPLAAGGLIFVNPEYGSKLNHTVKHVQWYAERGGEIILLTPARTDTRYGQRLLETHDALCFWSGRINFDAVAPSPVGEQFDLFSGAPETVFESEDSEGSFPPLFTYWGPRVWEFKQAFSRYGAVFMRGRGHTGPWAHRASASTTPTLVRSRTQ